MCESLGAVSYSPSTLCSKKNMWPHFRWQVKVELSVYKHFWQTYYQQYKPSTGIFIPTSPISCNYFTLGNCRDLNIMNLALNCRFSQCYNTYWYWTSLFTTSGRKKLKILHHSDFDCTNVCSIFLIWLFWEINMENMDINCKIVTILFCLLITQLAVYNRTITRFIADDNVVYQWVRWEIRLASDNSWARHHSKHVSWRSRWIIFLYTLEQRMAVSCEI